MIIIIIIIIMMRQKDCGPLTPINTDTLNST